jgi:hypothetical protein
MASGKTSAEAARLLDASNGTTTFTAPTTPMKIAVNTAVGSATAAGTEATGGSYARQSVTWTSASGNPATSSNSNAQTYTNMPAGTMTSVDEFDSNGTPRRSWWGTLTANKTTNVGDTLSFAIGALVKTDA